MPVADEPKLNTRELYARVDKIVEQKQGKNKFEIFYLLVLHDNIYFILITDCAQRSDCQCNCKYSPRIEVCPIHGTTANAEPQPYVLPVNYDPHNMYADLNSFNRFRRSAKPQFRSSRQTPFPVLTGHFDTLRANAARHAENFGKAHQSAQERVSNLKLNFDPIVARTGEFMQGFAKNFALPAPVPARRRRNLEVKKTEQNLWPKLKVNEKEMPCSTMESLKKLSKNQDELRLPEVLQFMPELQEDSEYMNTPKNCRQCDTILVDTNCNKCGTQNNYQPGQPQFFEYVQGQPVSYIPGVYQPERSASPAPRYVYDRFGHKFIESNGNLRLIAPQFQEPTVGQPNYATLADILNDNQEAIRDVNPFNGDRMIPRPLDLAEDTVDFIRDLSRRQADYYKKIVHPEEQSTEAKVEEIKNTKNETLKSSKKSNELTKSIYQIIPMKHDGKNGNVVVKLYPTKKHPMKTSNKNVINKKITGNETPEKEENNKSTTIADELVTKATNELNENTEKTVDNPKFHKIIRNNKNYEVLTIDTDFSSNDSNEEVDRILTYIYDEQLKQLKL